MDAEKYLKDVLVTLSADMPTISERLKEPSTIHLLHSAIGMSTEAGEILDMVKRHVFYGKPLDWVNLEEEFGDSNWYQMVGVHAARMAEYSTSLEVICDKNIAKLKARYGEKFSEAAANERDLDNEREVLEGGQSTSSMVSLETPEKEGDISFFLENDAEPSMLFESNGDIYIKGKLVDNDVEVLRGFREYLIAAGMTVEMETAKGVFSKFSNKERYQLMQALQELGVEK